MVLLFVTCVIRFPASRLHGDCHSLSPEKLLWFLVKIGEDFSNLSFFFISSVSNVSDHLLLPSGDSVHACAIISASCLSVYFLADRVLVYLSERFEDLLHGTSF